MPDPFFSDAAPNATSLAAYAKRHKKTIEQPTRMKVDEDVEELVKKTIKDYSELSVKRHPAYRRNLLFPGGNRAKEQNNPHVTVIALHSREKFIPALRHLRGLELTIEQLLVSALEDVAPSNRLTKTLCE